MKSIVYEQLAAVRWQTPARSCRLFDDHGIAHGFTGRGDQPPPRHHVRQVHGVALVAAREDRTGVDAQARAEADGVYTEERGVAVAVKTADCVPLLLCDEDKRVALAVHAGWRGLTSGIVAAAVDRARALGAAPERLIAAIGPCIRLAAFEVGPEVVAALDHPACGLTTTQTALCSAKGAGDRWHVDLQSAAALILMNRGMKPERIGVVQACTHTMNTEWHSARREGPGFGSNWSWIRL